MEREPLEGAKVFVPPTEEVRMSSQFEDEKKLMAFDRRPRIIAGVIGLAAVVAVVVLVAYMIASGFVTGP
jgi:hypothetical protein